MSRRVTTAITNSVLLVALGGVTTACGSSSAPPGPGAPPLPEPATPTEDPVVVCSAGDLPLVEIPATSGATARENLDAQIDGARDKVDSGTASLSQKRTLVQLLLQRTQYGGTYDDFDEALALTTAEVEANPTSGEAHVIHASVLSALHRWDEALEVLDTAEELGAAVDEEREGIALSRAEGVEAILAVRQGLVDELPSFRHYANLAIAQSTAGDYEAADASFVEAARELRSGSPFPAAWIYFQRGLMWSERADEPGIGCAMYREAIGYLPSYVVATTHLAEIELDLDGEAATSRLRAILSTTTDPEPPGFLGEILQSRDDPEAGPLIAQAATRYDELLTKHRLAFADHGAEFFMGPGADPERALDLALDNLANRETGRAYAIAIEAALAAGARGQACSLAEEADLLGSPNVGLQVLVEELLPTCE